MRSASGYGRGRKSTASTTLKIAVQAPMPSASETTAAAVKAGRVRNMRAAYLRSCHKLFMTHASSFISQGNHRIDFGRTLRRHEAGKQRDRCEQQSDDDER